MLPIKKILCPTDFSEPSFEGVKVGNELAAFFSAELIVIHVVSPVHVYAGPYPAAGFDLEAYMEKLMEVSNKSLQELVDNKTSPDLGVRTRVLQGAPADEIVNTARSEGVDVIVTATHGWTGWRNYIFGSVAEKVVRSAICPVVTVPAPQD